MKHRRATYLAIISYTTLTLATILLLLGFYWLFWPYKLIEFQTPYNVDTKVVEQGKSLVYHFNYCKYTDLMPEVTREYIDGIIYTARGSRARVTRGCGTAINSDVVPINLPPGEYTLQVTIKYKVNPIRTITYINETEKFTVIERK